MHIFGFSSTKTALFTTGVTGTLQIIFTLPTVLYLDKFGRETFLIVGATGMFLCHIVVAVLAQEIFPNSQRSRSVSIVASINWMFNFIIGLTTKDMLGAMQYGTYIFAIFSALGGLFIWKFSPETKDKTLEELGVFFGGDRTELLEPIVCARCGPTKSWFCRCQDIGGSQV
ncbi:hypothetical protein E8E15_005046 [Penicillium rubens]|nr:hypothetical protein E8E15_005046 [Penicillium rubens]